MRLLFATRAQRTTGGVVRNDLIHTSTFITARAIAQNEPSTLTVQSLESCSVLLFFSGIWEPRARVIIATFRTMHRSPFLDAHPEKDIQSAANSPKEAAGPLSPASRISVLQARIYVPREKHIRRDLFAQLAHGGKQRVHLARALVKRDAGE
jgi:hypothetical protein